MTFSDIWSTLPPGMRRCGRKEGERAYHRAMKATTPERFLTGLQAYIKGKEDWRAWVHFTTFCNQERWDIDPADYEEPVEKTHDQRRHESELFAFLRTGEWRGSVNMQPTRDEAIERLRKAGGWDSFLDELEPRLRIVK